MELQFQFHISVIHTSIWTSEHLCKLCCCRAVFVNIVIFLISKLPKLSLNLSPWSVVIHIKIEVFRYVTV